MIMENFQGKMSVSPTGCALDACRGPGKRILFVDDDHLIRKLSMRILEALGYMAECVRSGAEAIEAFRRARQEGTLFAGAVLDLNVEGEMNGAEIVVELRRFDPSLKAILASGMVADPVIVNYHDYGFDDLIRSVG